MIKRASPAVPPDPALADLLDAVRLLYAATDRFDASVAGALGVDRTAVRAINLMERGAVSPGQLGRALALSSGAVTAMLHRLEGAGHVERIDTDDGRRRDARLTAAGRRAADREFARLGRTIAAAFAGARDADVRRLGAGIRRLAAAFDDTATAAAGGA